MRRSWPTPLHVTAALALWLAAALLFPRAAAAQDEPAKPEPATLPAEALTYGAALEGQSHRKLLDWSKKYARELLRDEFSAGELTAESIAKLFPVQPPPAQEAIRFLVGYEVYRRASHEQENQASILRDLDRDIRNLQDRIRMLDALHQPIGTRAERVRQAQLEDANAQLIHLQTRRQLSSNAEKIEAARVDVCLRWLAEAHPRVKDTSADILRSVPPPRS